MKLTKTTLDQIVDMGQLGTARQGNARSIQPSGGPFQSILSQPGPLMQYGGVKQPRTMRKATTQSENPFMSIINNNTFLDELRRKYGY